MFPTRLKNTLPHDILRDKGKREIGTGSAKTRSKQNYEIEILVYLGDECETFYSLCRYLEESLACLY